METTIMKHQLEKNMENEMETRQKKWELGFGLGLKASSPTPHTSIGLLGSLRQFQHQRETFLSPNNRSLSP